MQAQSSAKKYALNTTWILIEKMSRIVSGILVGILVARYLGPEQFGIISYALNIMAIFSVFSSLGMDTIIVRELVIRKDTQEEILGTSFILRLTGGIGVVIAATLYSYLRDNTQTTFIVFLVCLSVVLQSLTVVDFYFQAQVRSKLTAINQVITLAISSIIKLILIYVHAPVEYFASMVILEALLTATNQCIFYTKTGKKIFSWKFSWLEVKELLSSSWPIIISGLVMVVYQKMDQVLIKRFLDLNSVGNYAAAIRISEASFFIPVAISAAVFPGIINAQNNKTLQTQRLTQLYSLFIWTAIFMCIGGNIFGDTIIGFLYKQGYELAPDIFKIHIWITIPVFFGTAWGMWMIVENKQQHIIYLNIISSLICYFLNITLIPKLGIKGAAYAIVITSYLGLLAVLISYKPKYTISLFYNAINPKNLVDIYKYYKSGKINNS
jgi:O-antigen/teichoic acid export membrane protein